MTAECDKKQAYMQKKNEKCVLSSWSTKHIFLAFGIVTCARPEVTLLSKELLYTRIASSTLSFLPFNNIGTTCSTPSISTNTMFLSVPRDLVHTRRPATDNTTTSRSQRGIKQTCPIWPSYFCRCTTTYIVQELLRAWVSRSVSGPVDQRKKEHKQRPHEMP